MHIEPLLESHYPEVRRIYEAGIATQRSTFTQTSSDYATFDAKHLKEGRLVAIEDGKVIGWVALSPTTSNCAYRGVAEGSLYIDPASQAKGVGKALMDAMIPLSEAAGIWTLEAKIIATNEPSLKLALKCGFRLVGIREKIGYMSGVGWMDVALLERRSQTVGID